MSATLPPRACPDAWTGIEDEVCAAFEGHGSVAWWFVAASILAAGALGAGLVWLVLKWTGWLQP